MFKNITINFSEPICSCKIQDLQWNINCKKSSFELHVWCKICDVDVFIPQDKMVALLEFDKPYVDIHYPEDNIIHVNFKKN